MPPAPRETDARHMRPHRLRHFIGQALFMAALAIAGAVTAMASSS